MLAVFYLIASVLFLQITVDKNPLVHISPGRPITCRISISFNKQIVSNLVSHYFIELCNVLQRNRA